MPRLAVLGQPISYSRSPAMQAAALAELGLAAEWSYEAIEVAPADFEARVRGLAAAGFVGANVTVPHKVAALGLAGEASEAARAIGAANTLSFPGGRVAAENTDATGFLDSLPAPPAGKRALVLGAGGSARAVVFGLIERGISRVHLANRTAERASVLADQFGANIHPVAWETIDSLLPRAGLLVNTTSLGMHGQPALELDASLLPSHAVVADLVYVPLETPLLSAARARGLKTADGLGMLLHQAVRGFELWFGTRPEVTPELRSLVETDLTKL